jgi:hypothetical protein
MDNSVPTVEVPQAEFRQWIHDLRNSLHALRIGLEMLPQVRTEETRFEQVRQLLLDEEQRLTARLAEFAASCPQRTNSP